MQLLGGTERWNSIANRLIARESNLSRRAAERWVCLKVMFGIGKAGLFE